MLLVTDEALVIQEAMPAFADYIGHPLVGAVLCDAIPVLASLDRELAQIATGAGEPWRIPGIYLSDRHYHPSEVVILWRHTTPGLLVAARRMDADALIEQTLRQQRNELILQQEESDTATLTLRTTQERMRTLDRQRQALLNLIAAEIKSSLSVVSGYAEWLESALQAQQEPAHRQALQTIMQRIQQLNQNVEDMLAIERIELALADLHVQPLDLAALVQHVVTMWQSVSQLRNVTLVMEATPEAVPVVAGDKDLIEEAIASVVRAMVEPIESSGTVRVQVSPWDKWVIVWAREQGKVIGAQRAAHGRAPAASPYDTSPKLARARLIAEGHGGHLSIETKAGQSQGVSLWLPAMPGLQLRAARPAPKPAAKPIREAAPPAPTEHLVVAAGSIRINLATQRVWKGEEVLVLSASEYRLLEFLAQHADQVVTHQQLLEAVWSYDEEVSLDNLRVLIWRLRQRIEDNPRRAQHLRTVRGFGYLLVG